MDILVVNNKTSFLKELKHLLAEDNLHVVDSQQLDNVLPDEHDLIMISGGHSLPIVSHKDYFSKEIELVKKSSKPVLGICLGFEIVAVAFGGNLVRLESEEKGPLDIEILEPDNPLFAGVERLEVFESHRWGINELPGDLVGLARSKDGYEVIKHRDKEVYGFQFHPEKFFDTKSAETLMSNFKKMIAQKASLS